MHWSVEFLDPDRLLVHVGGSWRIRDWPTLQVLDEGEGLLRLEPGSRRRLRLTASAGWDVEGFGAIPVAGPVQEVVWHGPDGLLTISGDPSAEFVASRLPTPETGPTAHVFGASGPSGQVLSAVPLDGSQPHVLARAVGPGESISDVQASGRSAFYVATKVPIPGFELGRTRARRVDPRGVDVDPYPELAGATMHVGGPPAASGVLVAHSDITSFFPSWWRLSRPDGRPLQLPGGRQHVSAVAWSADGRWISVPAEKGLFSTLVVGAVTGNRPGTAIATDGWCDSLAFVPDGEGELVYLCRRMDGSVDLMRTPPAGREHEQLVELMPAPRPDIDVSAWRWTSAGAVMEGILARPRNDKGKPMPMVVDLHGGPSPGLTAGRMDVLKWCDHGYVGFAPEFRSSGSLGPGPMLAGERELPDEAGATDVDDVLTGVRSLVDSGIADPNALYVFGHSYGGHLTRQIVANTSQFRAAVSWEGGSDMSLDYLLRGGNPISWELLGGHPWEVPNAYARGSSLHSADRIHTPLLLISGDEYPYEAIALYTALRGRDRAVQLVIYADEGHVMKRPENDADVQARTLAWFRAHSTHH